MSYLCRRFGQCKWPRSYREYHSYIEEESSAGAFFGTKLASGGVIECLTPPNANLPNLQSGAPPAGAGKVRSAAFAPDGSLVLHANFSVRHAVTAACGLWASPWPAAPPTAPTRLSKAGHEIQKFGWGGSASVVALWATALEGVARRTFVVVGGETIGASISTNVAYSSSGAAVYGLVGTARLCACMCITS